MSHQYQFQRGDRVSIISGKYAGSVGTLDSRVFQRSVDLLGEFSRGYHVVLDSGKVVTIRVDQVRQ